MFSLSSLQTLKSINRIIIRPKPEKMLSKTSLTAAALALASSAAAQTFTLNVTGTPSYLDSVLTGYATLSYAAPPTSAKSNNNSTPTSS